MFFGHLNIRNSVGLFGENAAVELLKRKGFRIVERNCKIGHWEMDIIAENKDVIAFVEVKTRTSVYGRNPEEYVDARKREHLTRFANAYVKMRHITKMPRIDIIGILKEKDTNKILEINHIEDAFLPRVRTYGH